jgi:ribosomal protein S18 acetylase RimI-like enzyme
VRQTGSDTSPPRAWRRVPFSPDDADALAAFSVANDGTFDAALVRRLLLELTSDAAGVFVLADAAGSAPAFVATVVDRAENGAGAAHLEVLAADAAVPASAFAALVVAPAIAFARAGTRRSLHVTVTTALGRVSGAEAVLRDAGFETSHALFTMVRRADAEPPAGGAPLPAGWRWAEVDDGRAADVHALLADAFRDAPSFSLSPLPMFRRAVISGAMTCRVLLDGEIAAGFVNVVAHETHAELRTVARAPGYAGRGLGPRLVGEGLRLALARGVCDVELTVEARNDRALALYRRFGFEIAARLPVVALDLQRV